MVGNSDNDAIGTQEIGTSFIGVTYGFGSKPNRMFAHIQTPMQQMNC